MSRSVSTASAILGLLAFMLMGALQALYGPSLPGLSQQFDVPLGSAGLIVSAHGLGALLGVLGAAALARHSLARFRVGGAVGLLAVGALAVGAASVWSAVLLGALMAGLGYGALTLGLNSVFAVGFGPRSAAMVNVLNAVFGLGAIASPLLVGRMDASVGWPFLVVALGAGVLTPFALRLDDRVPAAGPMRAAQRPSGVVLGFLALLALGVGLEASSAGWTATYLVSLGYAPVDAAGVVSLFYLVFTLSRLAAVPLSLRSSPQNLVGGALVLAVATLLLAGHPVLAPWALVTLGGAVALLFPNIFTWLVRRVPGAGSGTALVVAGALLGGALFPALVGQAVARFGASVLPWALLVLALGTLGLTVWVQRGSDEGHPT